MNEFKQSEFLKLHDVKQEAVNMIAIKMIKRCGMIGVAVLLASCGTTDNKFVEQVDGQNRIIPIFIATTRNVTPDGQAGNQLSSTTNYLANVISIPPDHQTGVIEQPRFGAANKKSHFVFVRQRLLDHDTFRSEIAAQLSGRVGASRDVMIFVHGYNTGYNEARFRLAQIAVDSNFTGVPVLFSWPSQARTFAYGADKENATASRDDLDQVVNELATIQGIGRIHIVAHSMGTWLTMEALREAAIAGRGDYRGHLGEVMLAAPDIDLDVFKQQLSRVAPFARISVFASADDRALSLSRMIAGDRQRVGSLDLSKTDQREQITKLGVRVYDLSNSESPDFFRHGTFAEAPEAVRAIGAQLGLPPDDIRQAQAFGDN